MKKIAESLGMGEPILNFGDEYSIDDQSVVPVTENQEIEPIDDSKEDASLTIDSKTMDNIIKHTIQNAKYITTMAQDNEPRSQARMYEVGGQYYKIALDALKLKQDAAFKNKHHRLEKAKTGMSNTMIGAQQNNFYGTREEIMKMLKEQKDLSKKTIEPEDTPDENDL